MTRGPKSPIKIILSDEERAILEELLSDSKRKKSIKKRAKTILMLSEGHCISHIKRTVSLERRIVHKWAYRFLKKGFDGLKDTPRSGRPRKFSDEVHEFIMKIVYEDPKKYGKKFKIWTCKAIKEELIEKGIVESISYESVRRLLKQYNLPRRKISCKFIKSLPVAE